MWLFLVEAYLFVLVAFTLGVAVGLVAVRIGVRRVAPARVPRPKPAKDAKRTDQKTRRGRKSKAGDADATADPGEASPSAAGRAS